MTPPAARIIHADALDALRELDDNSVDAVVTDPPYGLTGLTTKKVSEVVAHWVGGDRGYVPAGRGFMDMHWDRFVPPPSLWDEALRVLKPGGFLAAFAGARTTDLMGLSIRLAGFDIQRNLAWIRADAFAKSPYTLKPGHEPITLAQKPCEGSVAANIERWGVGALNIETCRIPYASDTDEAETKTKNAHGRFGTRNGGNEVFGDFGSSLRTDYDPPGRWPSDVILDEAAAELLDATNPRTVSRKGRSRSAAHGDGWGMTATGTEHDDAGGPSRFFAKFAADTQPLPCMADGTPAGFHYAGRAPTRERVVGPDGTKHHTVKPLAVMRWLVRLTSPVGGLVVDPFAGSGTTLEAALLEGRNAIGSESHGPYIPLIHQRIARAQGDLD